jgi:tripartite ATP-independent transporter DctP family solute receptor
MKRSYLALAVVALMLLITMGVNNYAIAAPKTYTLRLAVEHPTGHPYTLGVEKFAEMLEERTNGQVKVLIYPGGQLGTAKESTEACVMGAVDFSVAMTAILENYDQRFEVMSMPFVFRDFDHMFKTVDGPFGDRMNSWGEPKGFKIIGCLLNGDLHVVSRVPVNGPADMKGIKLRTQQARSMIEFGKVLNCVVSPMPYGEIFTALQLGTIDAEVQNIANLVVDKHYEVAGYYNETAVFFYVNPIIVSMTTYNRLPADIQEAIVDCGLQAARWQRAYVLDKRDKEYIPFLKKHMKFAPADQAAWKKALEDTGYYENFKQHKELLDEIAAVE